MSTERASTAGTDQKRTRSTAINGLLGGLVAIFLSFVPLSTALGGIVAGYLEGRDRESGFVAGVYAGVVYAAIVALLSILGLGFVFGMDGLSNVPSPGPPVFGSGFLFFGLAFVGIYALIAGGLGGALGSYLNEEFGDDVGRV